MMQEFIIEVLILIGCIGGITAIAKRWIFTAQTVTLDQVASEVIPAIRTMLLYYMSEAEEVWKDYEKSGAIKKSQVISEIYARFPILHQVIDQESVVKMISDMIEEEMVEFRKILEKNKE